MAGHSTRSRHRAQPPHPRGATAPEHNAGRSHRLRGGPPHPITTPGAATALKGQATAPEHNSGRSHHLRRGPPHPITTLGTATALTAAASGAPTARDGDIRNARTSTTRHTTNNQAKAEQPPHAHPITTPGAATAVEGQPPHPITTPGAATALKGQATAPDHRIGHGHHPQRGPQHPNTTPGAATALKGQATAPEHNTGRGHRPPKGVTAPKAASGAPTGLTTATSGSPDDFSEQRRRVRLPTPRDNDVGFA